MTDQEEAEAHAALRAAPTKDELIAAWWVHCEHSKGAQRERLQDTYAMCLLDFAPLSRAG